MGKEQVPCRPTHGGHAPGNGLNRVASDGRARHDNPCPVAKGGGPNLAQTRLYIYPDLAARELHFLTIGDEATQKDDIQFCRSFVTKLRGKAEVT